MTSAAPVSFMTTSRSSGLVSFSGSRKKRNRCASPPAASKRGRTTLAMLSPLVRYRTLAGAQDASSMCARPLVTAAAMSSAMQVFPAPATPLSIVNIPFGTYGNQSQSIGSGCQDASSAVSGAGGEVDVGVVLVSFTSSAMAALIFVYLRLLQFCTA